MRRGAGAVLITAALILPLGSPVRGETAEVTVRVVNGTDRERVARGVAVKVRLLKGEGSNRMAVSVVTGKTGPDGTVTLDVGETGEADYADASAEYRGAAYTYGPVRLTAERHSYEFPLYVYEISDSDGLVRIKDRQVYVRDLKGEELSIYETVTFINASSTTYVGTFNDETQLTETLRIGLPGGYERPSLDGPVDRGRVRLQGDGMVFLEAIPPGEKTVYLTYRLKSEIGLFRLSYPVSTPHERFRFFVPSALQWKAKVKSLKGVQDAEVSGKVYRQWEARGVGMIDDGVTPLSAEVLREIAHALAPTITLTDPSKGGFGQNELAVVFGLIVSIVLGVLYLKKSAGFFEGRLAGAESGAEDSGTPEGESPREERERLAALLQRLEGEISGNREAGETFEPYRELLAGRIEELDGLLDTGRSGD